MDKALEKLDKKDGTNDNRVSLSSVKKAAKKEGYSVGEKKKDMAGKMKPQAKRIKDLNKEGHVVLRHGKDWLDTYKKRSKGGNEITVRDYSYNWKGHKDYVKN